MTKFDDARVLAIKAAYNTPIIADVMTGETTIIGASLEYCEVERAIDNYLRIMDENGYVTVKKENQDDYRIPR